LTGFIIEFIGRAAEILAAKLMEATNMFKVSWPAAAIIINFFMHPSAGAQTLEVKRYNYAEWTKGRFTEVVTVTGPGKMIFLAGVGAEDEDKPQGAIRHLGNPAFNANTPTTK
jgi:hypothetical protein